MQYKFSLLKIPNISAPFITNHYLKQTLCSPGFERMILVVFFIYYM